MGPSPVQFYCNSRFLNPQVISQSISVSRPDGGQDVAEALPEPIEVHLVALVEFIEHVPWQVARVDEVRRVVQLEVRPCSRVVDELCHVSCPSRRW